MSNADATGSLVVYSDYICPFCYIGRAALRTYLRGAGDPPSVEWHPFDLRGYKRGPTGTVSFDADDGKGEAYHRRVRENVERLSARYDLSVPVDAARRVDSRPAHQAALYVRRAHGDDAFVAFHHAVFDALWLDEREIDDPDVLAAIGDGVGVDPDAIREALVDERLSVALSERFAAAERDGVVDIPTFAYDDQVTGGVATPEQLGRLVEEEPPGSDSEGGAAY